MATGLKTKRCRNIRELKNFIKDIPDDTPIRGDFTDDRVTVTLWKKNKEESGPRKYIGFDTETIF